MPNEPKCKVFKDVLWTLGVVALPILVFLVAAVVVVFWLLYERGPF